MCNVRYIFTQALNFAYRNNLILHDIGYSITRFSGKNKEREIFTKAETQKIFNGNANHFNRLDCFFDKQTVICNRVSNRRDCRTPAKGYY